MSVNALNKSTGSAAPSGQNNIASAQKGDANVFKQTLENQIAGIDRAQSNVDKHLKNNAEQVKAITLSFSNHAVERMSQRGIVFSPEQIAKIENAASKAQAKGSKETLIFANDSALIVNLKDKKVVTVMDKNALRENVFTNIDSTVVI